MGGVASKESCTSSSKAHFSLSDLFSPSTYKMSSSVLQALGKFLPVNYQKGVNSAVLGCPYHIGDFAQGGVIIWLTQDGLHGLVAAIDDATQGPSGPQVNFTWGPNPSSPAGVANNDSLPFSTPMAPYGQYYGGYKNQTAPDIVNNLALYEAFWAAANCTITVNGQTYADWWLPSSTELSLIYTIRDKINEVSMAKGGSFLRADKAYWSSRQYDSAAAWFLYIFGGDQFYNALKFNLLAVRCVRAF